MLNKWANIKRDIRIIDNEVEYSVSESIDAYDKWTNDPYIIQDIDELLRDPVSQEAWRDLGLMVRELYHAS